MVILITGGAGFVGSNLAIHLKTALKNSVIIALDNLKRRGSEINVSRLKVHKIKFIHGDIRNKEDLNLKHLGLTHIIECSAEPSVLAGFEESPKYLINTNLMGLVNCLELARLSGARVIFLSTSRVYPIETLRGLKYTISPTRFVLNITQPVKGVSRKGISEVFPLNGWRSLYGTTKLSSELIIHEYIKLYGLRAVIDRCGVIAGPWQMGKVDQGVFTYFLLNHFLKKPLSYIGFGGSGKQVRDILHIDDLADLILLQLRHLDSLNGQIFNVGGGADNSLSLLEATKICQNLTGNDVLIRKITKIRHADIPLYISDNTRVTKALGWRPQRNSTQTLSDIYNWIKTNKDEIVSALL